MAEVVGQNGLHNVRGFLCDLCGHACDPEAQELNALDCTFGNCPKTSAVYHQDCLEKYLKSVRLEKSRKTGFRCPRGTGKGTKFPDQPCPGKIDKSHPIHIRNDNAKKRRKAQMAVQIPEPRPKLDLKEKAKVKEEDTKRVKKREQSKEEAAKPSAPGKAAAKPLSKEEKAKQENLRLLAAAQALRRDMGLPTTAGSTRPAPTTFKSAASVNREPQTLEEYESAKAGGSKTAATVATAWATPKAVPKNSNPDVALQSSQASSGWASAAAASAPPPPPPSRRNPSTAATASATRPALKLTKAPERTAGLPIGMESAAPAIEEAPKLSKAQRKNLRRAEKKAAERSQEKMSVASSEVVSELDLISNEGDALSEIPVIEEEDSTIFTHLRDDCVQALTLFKAQSLIQQLRTLGYADWQCVPAIMVHGSDLEAAVTFLLDGGVQTAEQAQELLNAATELPQIDIAPELTRIHNIKEDLQLDLDDLQDLVVQHEGDVEKACSHLFDDNGVSSLSDPSSPEDSQSHAWKHGDDDAFGSLHSDGTEVDVDSGERWDGAINESNSLPASQQISQDQTHLGTSWTSSFFNNGIAAVQEPQQAEQQAKFDPQLMRSVRSIDRYNELLELPPPSADNKQVEQQQQQHTESLFSAIPRHQQQQHLPVYPNQPAAASYQSAYHHQGWNQTGGSVQHHQQDAPQAALYAAAAVTDARQPALDDQDLDIDKLLASLIAQ